MKKIAIGIGFLFIISSVTPIANGYNIEKSEIDDELGEMLDNLRFSCTTPYGFSKEKYEYHKEKLTYQYSSMSLTDNIVFKTGKKEIKIQSKKPLEPLSFNSMDCPWPMKCHDKRHTSRSPYSTSNNMGDNIWNFECERVEGGSIIGSDGTIYFGSWDNYLYAIYQDGTLKWKYETDGWIWSTPAIATSGIIYVGSWDGGLYAVYPNGTEKWRFGSGAQISSSPVIGDDGTIYFGIMGPGDIGRIYAVNPNGTEKWHYDTGYWIVSDPCIGGDGTLYIGSGDTYLYAMNSDGTLKWRFKTGDEIHGDPSVGADGTIYIGSYDNYLYAVNPNGTEKWNIITGWGISNCQAIAEDGTIYVGTDHLYAIYPNGTNKWSFDLGADRWIGLSSPAISADEIIYVGVNIGSDDGGEILAVNLDGSKR